MIADTAVTMGSLWMSEDHEIQSEDVRVADDLQLGLNLNIFEAEVSRLHRQPSTEVASDMYSLLSSVSCDASVASSECSDDLCVDIEGDDGLFCDLQASILNLLDDNSNSSVLDVNNMDLVDGEWNMTNDFDCQSITSDYSSASSQSSNSASSKHKSLNTARHTCSSKDKNHNKGIHCRKHLHHSFHPKNKESAICREESSSSSIDKNEQNSQANCRRKWSHLSSTEQVALVEELSQVISTELGLREQLDVIRIIKPGAKISPTDREFVIDLETLDDAKLQSIQEYVKLHMGSAQDSSQDSQVTSQRKTSKKQKCQDRRNQQKVIRQRQRKAYRQLMKERRSGLFVKEEVLALSSTDPGEEDVDVLM